MSKATEKQALTGDAAVSVADAEPVAAAAKPKAAAAAANNDGGAITAAIAAAITNGDDFWPFFIYGIVVFVTFSILGTAFIAFFSWPRTWGRIGGGKVPTCDGISSLPVLGLLHGIFMVIASGVFVMMYAISKAKSMTWMWYLIAGLGVGSLGLGAYFSAVVYGNGAWEKVHVNKDAAVCNVDIYDQNAFTLIAYWVCVAGSIAGGLALAFMYKLPSHAALPFDVSCMAGKEAGTSKERKALLAKDK